MSDELDSILARPVDRKGFIAAGALGALMAAGGGRFLDAAEAAKLRAQLSGTLYYYNWADYVNPKTYGEYTKKTGVKVKKDFFASNEVLLAKLKAGARGYDLSCPSGYMVQVLAAEKLLEPIDWSKLPNVKRNIDAKFRHLPFDPKDKYSVAKDWGTTGFMYRTDKIKERPTTWKQFFDLMKKYSGKFTLLDSSPEVVGSIAVMMGYSYSTEKQSELDKVKEFLLDLKQHVHSLDASTYKQKIASGKAWGGLGWNGDGIYVETHSKAKYVVAKEGGEFWVDSYVIPKGSKNSDAAHAWINFAYDPRIAALECSYTYYGSPVKRAMLKGKLSSKILANTAVFPTTRILASLEPNRVTAKGTRLRERIWTEFKAA
ncbi:MAG: PotD/PotF family extracellular solute-binding protein [Gaiellaceae bacterium]